eukprot:4244992-Alexandrium_andersonii.AAC.1
MSASLVGSEMCIRDRRRFGVTAGSCLGLYGSRQPARCPKPLCTLVIAVSYTHLTLPTICSV